MSPLAGLGVEFRVQRLGERVLEDAVEYVTTVILEAEEMDPNAGNTAAIRDGSAHDFGFAGHPLRGTLQQDLEDYPLAGLEKGRRLH